ncbi:ABC transporter substrate-binding protein [Pseudoruegeria sp. SHC-113]|uniref:ABC transporter substrate-binding protein n=1 Tax=Pseudoruegeria sp. SHC-113 TaxID=2855439 RepID=UPI0021BABAEF|nr:CmpA/NrtA family ABC transporter substrate-binding protein [Pseudoruegeria sp. SHC-113]MCT8161070.1 ABC transporter substrate-binding protein [Pseudoruegeria sp. SHC-113]
MKPRLTAGFIPLVDCAPLVVAHELGFAEREGFQLDLVKQPSWSAIRDMLALGHIEAAHMLSPMPVAMSLGLGGLAARVDVLMVLSANGNSMGVTPAIAERMRANGWSGDFNAPFETGKHLIEATGGEIRLGVPFPFSMHAELFYHWLGALGISSGEALDVRTIPPPRMAEAIGAGEIDAFCVGEPWGSLAVETGVAELVLPGSAIWAFAPEKVLAVRHEWCEENPDLTRRLMRAVHAASRWLGEAENRMVASELLARSDYLDLSDSIIDRALTWTIQPRMGQLGQHVENFQRFHGGAATFPWRSQGAWIATHIAARAGLSREEALEVARGCFRSDLYRANLTGTGADMPGASEKLEGALPRATPVASVRGEMILGPDAFFDGQVFDFGT